MLKNEKDSYLKMSAIVSASGESKSTILYYVKEKLLPKPRKHKTNLHLYHKSSIEILKFIKLLKEKFNLSIEEIKQIIANLDTKENNIAQKLISILKFQIKNYSDELFFENDLLIKSKISSKELNFLIDEQIIEPINNKFTAFDLEIIETYKYLKKLDISTTILKNYLRHSKEIAVAETNLINEILEKDLEDSEKEKLIFDLIFNLKNKYMVKILLDKLTLK